jgi:hypothetical protein
MKLTKLSPYNIRRNCRTNLAKTVNNLPCVKTAKTTKSKIKTAAYEAEIRLTRIKEVQDIRGQGEEIGREFAT